MRTINARQLVTAGLMAALVTIGTMIIQVPTPTKGYIHAGDTLVYLCGILLGPWIGALAAATGSLFADIFSGYGIYAPATFVIKGLDALVVGYLYHMLVKEGNIPGKLLALVLAVLVGGSVMVAGYLAYETALYGMATALLGIPGNITQAAGGGLLAAPLLIALDKMNLQQYKK